MNMTLKRLICLILVFSLLLSMPGCATIDGRPASFFEAVFWLVGGILQATALVVGELVLFVIFAAIDVVMRGIESVTGGDWWVVEDVGGPIMRGYIKLIDPNGRFVAWSEEEKTTEPEGTTPATEPNTVPATEPAEETAETEDDSGKIYADPKLPVETFHVESSGSTTDYEEKWGRYTIRYETNGGTVQTEGGGMLQDQYVWKWTVLSWWPDPAKVLDQIPYRPQYRFIGWGLTPDAQTIDYAPNMSLKGITESMTLYAMWAKCTEHSYAVNEVKDNKLLCRYCHSPIPMSELKFSVFLDYYYPGETPEKMKPERKQEALNRYIMTKSVMTKDELKATQNFVNWGENEGRTHFERLASAEAVFLKIQGDVTLQNSKHLFLVFNFLLTMTDEVQYAKKFGAEVKNLNNAGTFLAGFDFVATAMAANDIAASYNNAKDKGIEYAYYQEEAFLDLAEANAQTLAALANFICNFCTYSLNAPKPNADALIKESIELGKQARLEDIYRILVYPVSTKTCVNDALAARGVEGRFAECNYYTEENIIAAMKAGPSAKDFSLIIKDTLDRVSNADGDKDIVQFAMWYYYGWRLQYDYECFIQDILNDKI